MKGETGFYQRARVILDGAFTADEDKYLRAEFPSARDRTTSLAATVGTAGSFLLALVAIVVAIASGVSEQSAKVITAGNAVATLAAGCTEENPSPACTDQRVEQARQGLATSQTRLEEVASLNQWNAVVAAFVLVAFFLGLIAQFSTPVVPKAATAAAWTEVLTRYQIKRFAIVGSLVLQIAAAVVLVGVAVGVFF